MYYPLYVESNENITLKYDTQPNGDIEVILQSVIAYKKLILKTSAITSGKYTDNFEENYPEILMIIDKYYKGSDVFEFVMKIIPKKHQQKALVTCTVMLGIGGLIFMVNQLLDLYIKINKISDTSKIEQEFEAFKIEVNEKITKYNIENQEDYANEYKYELPVSFYNVIDSTYDDYQAFVKPLRHGIVRSISVISNNKVCTELNNENSLSLQPELINERTVTASHKIRFIKIDKNSKKSWKVAFDNGKEIKADIQDNKFFKKVEVLSENPLNKDKSYAVNTIEYWRREKGEESLSLKKLDILEVQDDN